MALQLRALALGVLVGAAAPPIAQAGVIFGFSDAALGGGARWDAAPRTIGANERSLDGGLRYAVSGGSLEAFRNQFTWSGPVPSVADFSTAVQAAFNSWSSVDPVSGLGSALSFVYDPVTAVAGVAGGGININGAEIDLIATTDASFWDPGNGGLQGETWFNVVNDTVRLTSGTANYAGSKAISGADVYINSNPQAAYTLDIFRRLLTHELGHAIGLGDIEGDINPGAFIDDNFDPVNALATMTNSWALQVNPLNPAASPGLQRYSIGGASTTPGVDILMESRGLGIAAGNPVTNPVPLTNDDYGTRQFLYPSLRGQVPEPDTLALGALSLLVLGAFRRRGLVSGRNRPT